MKKYVSYINKVFMDALKSEERAGENTQYQMIEYNGDLLISVKTPYLNVLRRVAYRLENNLMKNFPEIKSVTLRRSNAGLPEIYGTLDFYPEMIPPHHTVARCDLWGKPAALTIFDRDWTKDSPLPFLEKLNQFGYDYTNDDGNWEKYIHAIKCVTGHEIPDLTSKIISHNFGDR